MQLHEIQKRLRKLQIAEPALYGLYISKEGNIIAAQMEDDDQEDDPNADFFVTESYIEVLKHENTR